jgi:hypothetical protein
VRLGSIHRVVAAVLAASLVAAGCGSEPRDVVAEVDGLCTRAVDRLSRVEPYGSAQHLVEGTNGDYFEVLNGQTFAPMLRLEGSSGTSERAEALAGSIQDLVSHMADVRVLVRDGQWGEAEALLAEADVVMGVIDAAATHLGATSCAGAALGGRWYADAAHIVAEELAVTSASGDFRTDARAACAAYAASVARAPAAPTGSEDLRRRLETIQPATLLLARRLEQITPLPGDSQELERITNNLLVAEARMRAARDDLEAASRAETAAAAEELVHRALAGLALLGVECGPVG